MNWPAPQSQWIWLNRKTSSVNQFVEFRKTYNLRQGIKNSRVFISVDSDYELWVNGNFIGWNQFPNWPKAKTFNTHDVDHLLKRGKNCVAVRVRYRGKDFSTHAKGKPGFLFALQQKDQTVLSSDETWRCRLSKTYHSGPMPWVSHQLDFTLAYDARGDDQWQESKYNDQRWQKALALAGPTDGYWESLKPRPLPSLIIHAPCPTGLVASGFFTRQNESKTVAQTMMQDAISPFPLAKHLDYQGEVIGARPFSLPDSQGKPLTINPPDRGRGIYLVFDLGSEQAGLLNLDIDAPAGTILDIAHGEHLDDLRVRAAIADRNFADRYICGKGRQQWLQPYRKLGCRYLQLHIPKLTRPIKIYHLTLRLVEYPFKHQGDFTSSDQTLNNIWQVSRRTLTLCAHEHYEDCPWREQAMYACDSRLQALYGYYAFGETQLPSACWDLLGSGMRDDGLLELVAPGKCAVNIPCFSLHWISAVWELYLHSGNYKQVAGQYDKICTILDTALERFTPAGVVANSQGSDHWHFYEWSKNLSGRIENTPCIKPQGHSLDAVYNLLLINALRAAVKLGQLQDDNRSVSYHKAQKRIANAFHKTFWDHKRQLYASFKQRNKLSCYDQFTQSLAINESVTPSALQTRQLRKQLACNTDLAPAEFPSKLFVYQALLSGTNQYAEHVLADIRKCYGSMLSTGATSLWEATAGAEAFSRAGSLCHAWSSVLNFVAGAHILGIRPLEPGFKSFTVSPLTGDLPRAKGVVPTPHGRITIEWENHRHEFRLKLRHPKALTPILKLPKKNIRLL